MSDVMNKAVTRGRWHAVIVDQTIFHFWNLPAASGRSPEIDGLGVPGAVAHGVKHARHDKGMFASPVVVTPHHLKPTAECNVFFRDHLVEKSQEAANAVLTGAATEV